MAAESIMNDKPTLWDPGNFLRIVLRGIGQVMFQGHAGTGILFLVGIALASPLMAVGAIIGAFIGPVVAALARLATTPESSRSHVARLPASNRSALG